MGSALSLPTREVVGVLVGSLDECPGYRRELVWTLRRYQGDVDISPSQALQWTSEKFIKDLLDPLHLPHLHSSFTSKVRHSALLSSLDSSALTLCVGRAAMLVLEELKLDVAVHGRLFDLTAKGRVEAVKRLSGFVDFDYADARGWTALMVAAQSGQEGMVDFFLSLHPPPSVDAVDEKGWTALMISCRYGHLHIVRALTAPPINAQVDLVNSSNATALMAACEGGHFAIVVHLLSHSASPHTVSRTGDSALLLATKGGHLSIVKVSTTCRHSTAQHSTAPPTHPTNMMEAIPHSRPLPYTRSASVLSCLSL